MHSFALEFPYYNLAEFFFLSGIAGLLEGAHKDD